MAGIGIELRKILQEDTFSAQVRAYLLGALYALGPFLSSILCLASLSVIGRQLADLDLRQAFTASVVYVYGGSITVAGLLQVALTRYLADQVYRGEQETLVESIFPVGLLTAGLLTLTGLPFLALAVKLPMVTKVLLFGLYVTAGTLWMLLVFVSSTHRHGLIALIFLGGAALAVATGALTVRRFGLDGLLAAFTAGHFLTLVLLATQLFRQFGFPQRWDWGVLGAARTFPALLFIGLLQALGAWVDKFLFWGSELQLPAFGLLTAPKYDSSTFLAYLTAVPAIVHFFVRTEAEFADRFHAYFDEVFFRSSLDAIQRTALELRQAVKKAFIDIVKIQGVVTFLCAFFAVEILGRLGLPVSQVGMFRFAVVGSIFLVFMQFSVVLLLYLDRQREALVAITLFFAVNLGSTLVTLRLGYQFFGLGFAASALLGMLVALFLLARQLYHLEYFTFMRLPVLGQRAPRAALRARPGGMFGRYHPLHAQQEKT